MTSIKKMRRAKPRFPRIGAIRKEVDGTKWRKPRGRHGRIKKLLGHNKGTSPRIGYGSPRNIRYLHTSGLEIVDIANPKQLDNIDAKSKIIRISNVGKKKKIEIVQKAISKNIRISNLRKPQDYISKNKIIAKEVKK